MPSTSQSIQCSMSSFWTNDLIDFVPAFLATGLANPQRLLVATAAQELRVYDAAEDGSAVLRAANSTLALKKSPPPGSEGLFACATPDPGFDNTWWTSANGMTELGTPLIRFTQWRLSEDSWTLSIEDNNYLENGTRIRHESRTYLMDRAWDIDFLDSRDALRLLFSGVFTTEAPPSRSVTAIGVVVIYRHHNPQPHHEVLHAHVVVEEHSDREAPRLLLSVDRWSNERLIYTANRSTRRVSVHTYSADLMKFSELRHWSVGARFVEVFDIAARDGVVAIVGMRPDGGTALDLYDGHGVLQATVPFASDHHFTGVAFANSPAITAQHPRGAWLWRMGRFVHVDARADFEKRDRFLNRYHLGR